MGSKEGGADLSLLGAPSSLQEPQLSRQESPMGWQGAWCFGMRALEGGSLDRKGGPRCRNGWREVCPTSSQPSAEPMVRSADFCSPAYIPLFSLVVASLASFGEISHRRTRVGLALATWFQGWAYDSAPPIRAPYPVSLANQNTIPHQAGQSKHHAL